MNQASDQETVSLSNRTSPGRLWTRLGLRWQLVLFVTGVLVVTGALLGSLWTWKSQKILESELQKRGRAVAFLAASNGRYATFTEDAARLRPILDGIVQDAEVVYAVFTDAEGKILAKRVDPSFQENLEAALNASRNHLGGVYTYPQDDPHYYDIHAPVRMETARAEPAGLLGEEGSLFDTGPVPSGEEEVTEEHVGAVHVGISLETLQREKTRAVLWTLGLTLVVLVLSAGLALLAAGRVFRPVKEMVDLARGIARGDYSQTIHVESTDELGSLAQAFRRMQQNLQAVALQARAIAEGDLTQQVDAEGDLAEAFNRMVESLAALVGQIKDAGAQISSSSNKILAASRQQEQGSQEQAASISQTTTTMDELLAASKQIAGSSDAVVEIAEETLGAAQLGQEAVQEAIGGMEEIRKTSTRTAEQILALAEKNQQIGAIVEIIDEIADKTDLLALNAAIEGAKAGEAGRGFSIVATEMRALAENVVDSTKEIREIVSEVQKASQASVQATESQMAITDSGVDLAVRTGEQLQRILEMVEQTTEAARQISLATQQQRTGTEQVVHSMAEIAGIARQGVDGASQTTESAMELSDLADEFRRAISRFRLSEEDPTAPEDADQPLTAVETG